MGKRRKNKEQDKMEDQANNNLEVANNGQEQPPTEQSDDQPDKVRMIDEKETPLIESPEAETPEPRQVRYVAVGIVHGNNKKVFQPGEIVDCLDGIDLKARIDDGLIREVAE